MTVTEVGAGAHFWARSGSVDTAVSNTAPLFTQSALLKIVRTGQKEALIGNTNQGFLALEGTKSFEPSSNVRKG